MENKFKGELLSKQEVERIRLLLSTYQDGTGMLESGDSTIPGWRDFERSTAIAMKGEAQESKAVYDIKVPISKGTYFGISCKMRKELRKVRKQGRASMEISNAAKQFWDALNQQGITVENYKKVSPNKVGKILCDLIESWHNAVSIKNGGDIDLEKSYFLSLSWDETEGKYQLHQFDTRLPDSETFSWEFPMNGNGEPGKRIVATTDEEVVMEWYGESGGQFKYYPKISDQLWGSEEFTLEPLPDGSYGIMKKAEDYFPRKWAAANK